VIGPLMGLLAKAIVLPLDAVDGTASRLGVVAGDVVYQTLAVVGGFDPLASCDAGSDPRLPVIGITRRAA
jgi:hypothetical protein